MFDFAFLFERPVITVKYDVNKIGLEASDLPWDLWELTVLDTLGTRIEESELEKLPTVIEQELGKNDRKEKIRQLRDESVANFDHAAKDVVNEVLRIRDGLKLNQPA